MNRRLAFLSLVLCLSLGLLQVPSAAQTPTATASALPRLVRFGGTAKDLNGNPLTGVIGVTFALYSEQTGGAALWLETQNVTADGTGHYTALLGSTKPDGLPAELFTSEQARWVGVQISGQAEQPRVLLVSAPYALKAGDAETIGGLPPSAFMLASPAQDGMSTAGTSSARSASAGSKSGSAKAPVTSGTANYIPIFTDGSGDLGNSTMFQTATGIGIGTTTPAATLDVGQSGTINSGNIVAVNINAAASIFGNSVSGISVSASGPPLGGYYIAKHLFASGSNTSAFLGFAGSSSGVVVGSSDTGTGFGALALLNGGNLNTANGFQALATNAKGNNNTAMGSQALFSNSTGNNNTASGYQALYNNINSIENTASGALSLFSNTSGSNNTANGYQALYSNTLGTLNAASGHDALLHNTAGAWNTAVGASALQTNVLGNFNSAVGYEALSGNTGSRNTGLGYGAGGTVGTFTGSGNTYLGAGASSGAGNNSFSNSTAVGANAFVDESNALVLGGIAGLNGASGGTSVGIGTSKPAFPLDVAGIIRSSIDGFMFPDGTVQTTAAGGGTGSGTITGVTAGTGLTGGGTSGTVTLSLANPGPFATLGANTFTGNQTVNGNLSATGAVTGSSLQLGGGLFAFGTYASGNAFVGFSGSATTTGNLNTAIGENSLLNDTTGSSNTAVGYALFANTTGTSNTGVGVNTLINNTTGAFYTAIGSFAGQVLDSTPGTGRNDTALGSGAAFGTGNLTNATAIGSNAEVTESNALVLGATTGVNSGTSVNVGIGTTAPAATLDVHGTGNFTGVVNFGTPVTFAAGQTFPGTGTITAVSGSSGITGGGTSGSVVLGLQSVSCTAGDAIVGLGPTACSPFATLAANTFTGNQTVNGNLSATGVVTGSAYQIGTTLFAFGSPSTQNAFLGFAGNTFMTGGGNTADGVSALFNNDVGANNTAIGANTLPTNTAGNNNSALGSNAGNTLNGVLTGNNNSFLGANAATNSGALTNGTAIGANALVESNNSIVLGSVKGLNGATSNVGVGIGTPSPSATLDVHDNGSGGNTISATTPALNNAVYGSNTAVSGSGANGGFFTTSSPEGTGVVGVNTGTGGNDYAGFFQGNVFITGNLSKGGGSFQIDHPLDPANKFLYHSFVESPDMMNIYNGVATLDARGSIWITLPDYFEALNQDFRYQLTSMGRPQPSLYVAKEISGNRFRISGGKPGGKVSWQVTGIRHDAYADAHRIQVEVEKPPQDQGRYLHPELFGAPAEQAIGYPAPAVSTRGETALVSSPNPPLAQSH
jgi:hypothetical protein